MKRTDASTVSDDQREHISSQQAFTAWYEEALDIFQEENARLAHEDSFGEEVEFERIAAVPR